MSFLPFVILATLAWVVFASSWWPWMRAPNTAAYGPAIGGLGLFLLACEILWLVFGANSGCAR